MKRVHRHVTDAERARIPNAYSFNRATGRFHNRAGYEIQVPELYPPAPSSFSRAPRPAPLRDRSHEKNEEGEA